MRWTLGRSLFFLIPFFCWAQTPTAKDSLATEQPKEKTSPFITGYYPLYFFDVDLRSFIRYNNYEGFRFGIGGTTNERLFENFKIGGYWAKSVKDDATKYSLGASLRLNKERNTWLSFYYFKEIYELGSYQFQTDARVYSVFEPRRLNITQFYRNRMWEGTLQREFSSKVFGVFNVRRNKVEQLEDYAYQFENGEILSSYYITEGTLAVRISPRTDFITLDDGRIEYFDGLPKISAQVTQAFKNVWQGDFGYTKFGLKFDYYIKRQNLSSSQVLLEGSWILGDAPLTHLMHAYPNSPTKDEILQRFSIAGRRSFETMYFGEFFSSKLATLQLKHSLRRFYLSKTFQPELVFITRHALGGLDNRERHLGIPFDTLNHLYNETGFELNRILFGFGLSFAYRYGAYNLPDFEDNISFKFTFYLKL